MSVARRRYELAGEQADEPDWPEHEARAGDLAERVRPFSARSELYSSDQAAAIQAWIGEVRACAPDVTASLLLLLIRRAAAEGGWSHDTIWRVHGLRRSGLAWPAADAAYALRTAAALPDTWWASGVLVCVAAMAARTRTADDRRLATALAEFTASMRQREYVPARDKGAISASLARLNPLPPSGAPLDLAAITAADGWSAVVLAGLASFAGAAHPVNLLLHHLRSASGSRPAKKWLTQAAGLVMAPEARRVLRLLLEAATQAAAQAAEATASRAQAAETTGSRAEAAETAIDACGEVPRVVVASANADLLRAAAWAASCVDEEWVVPALSELAGAGARGQGGVRSAWSAKVPAACALSLGLIASADAIEFLAEFARETTDAGLRGQAAAALRVAAERGGLPAGELAERIVSKAGLDGHGERLIAAGGATARIRLTDDGAVSVQWRGGKGWVRRVPAAAGAAGEHAVRAAIRQVSGVLAAERRRLEWLLAQDRGWAVADWHALYLRHPVTRVLARGLLWTFEDSAGDRVTGMPGADGKLTTLDGAAAIPADATVRLWHPVRASAQEIAAWRDLLVGTGLRQQVRQVFREAYLPTQAELAAPAYSGRFEGDILRYPQAHALMTERGWTCGYLGPYDGGPDGRACREFPDVGLVAVFEHHALDLQEGDLQVELCGTGRVSFHRSKGRTAPVKISAVPDLVFSEAMRDVDLFVSTTSIALDPRWGGRADDRYFACWRERAFGELGQTGLVRRDALARIMPRLAFAGRLALTDSYLLVRGRRHDYEIHLGSANVRTRQDQGHLGLGPQSYGQARQNVPLPFDDRVLGDIVSLAQFLAAGGLAEHG